VVFLCRHVALLDDVVEARPARPRLELRARVEKRFVADDAAIGPLAVVVPVRPGERRLRTRLLGHRVLDRAELGATLVDFWTALLPPPQTTRVLLRSFGYAFAGIAYIVRTQRNARIELAVGAAAITLALWLGLAPLEWAVLAITIALVLALEWINTSLELAVTLASPERHPSAKAAKDVAAACVLLGATTSVIVGILVLGLPLISRLAGK